MKPRIDVLKVKELERAIETPGGGQDDVFTDGIIDIDKYNNAALRILWVLKEAVSDYVATKYDLELIETNIVNRSFARTLENIGYVSYAILNDLKTWEDIPGIYDGAAESLKQIAIINVKKSMGEVASNSGVIMRAFEENKSLVFQQIAVYNPDIVIMGYPYACEAIVDQIIDHFEPNPGPMKSCGDCGHLLGKNWLYLWVYHPAKPGNGKRYCEEILGAIEEYRTSLRNLQ
jgi:hypothetical protein